MKLTKVALGCALVTGLMAFAPVQSNAKGIVVSGVLYSPMNLKFTISYKTGVASNDPIKNVTFTSATALKNLGYNKDVTLATAPTGGVVHVYVINQKSKTVVKDLSGSDNASLSYTTYISKSTGTSTIKTTSQGFVNFEYGTTAGSGTPPAQFTAFVGVGGLFTASSSSSASNFSMNWSGKSLSGSGYINTVTFPAFGSSPASGSASGGGSQKF